MLPGEPFSPARAKTLAREILETGGYVFSQHALREMAKERPKLSQLACINVLRGGVYDPPELEDGAWRYRARTTWVEVILAFRSETELVVVTAWRTR